MPAAVIVVLVGVCLFGGTMADEPRVKVIFTGSNSSSGSTGSLLGCKPLFVPGPMVRFQALRTGGIEYTRKLVPSERMTFSDVVATNSNSKDIAECAEAASEKKWDAFSFVNGRCVGYKIGDGICPCTKGDFVLYLTKGAIRRPSSAKALTAAMERAAVPPPAGYIRKIIYSAFSMIDGNFIGSGKSCEDLIKSKGETAPSLAHFANGECYYTNEFSPYPCNSCVWPAVEVLFKPTNITPILFLSQCGETITPELTTRAEFDAGVLKPVTIYSHEGLGCLPYPDPASDAICDVTVLGPAGTVQIKVLIRAIGIDESTEGCNGDELYLYPGPVDGSACTKDATRKVVTMVTGNKATIRFQRKPAHNKNSVHRGFVMMAFAYDYQQRGR